MKPTTRDPGLDVVSMADAAVEAMDGLLADAVAKLRGRVSVEGHVVSRLFDREQRAAHSLAWLATYVEALRQFADYANRLGTSGHLGEIEELVVRIAFGEYLAQIFGGIPMSQSEIARLADIGLTRNEVSARMIPPVEALIASGNTAQRRARLVELLRAQRDATPGAPGVDSLDSIRDEMRKFVLSDVIQQAQRWHLTNGSIPAEVIAHMTELGVFGLTIPEDFSGMGLSKQAMCVAAEELSRGSIGVGSLATAGEVAADLIVNHGTEKQRRRLLRKIALGQMLPASAFTEPESGFDLASVRTRAVLSGDTYRVFGTKSWVAHAARADMLLLLVRTDPKDGGHSGLSILLAEKSAGNDERPFPVEGLAGVEIPTVGYRGMKQFEITFDGFEVPASALLGGVEGMGFKQAMQAFESARIQTAARGVGVAQSALDQAVAYAAKRQQFGAPIISLSRISDKIAMTAAEIAIARQLAYGAARDKDTGERADAPAAMAKLLGARVAWAAADAAVQVHGASGVTAESPVARILADARVLSILEGSSEILAQTVARRLLEGAS
jgi:(2S)-methylsuccinyl-CoA dehydrogenase